MPRAPRPSSPHSDQRLGFQILFTLHRSSLFPGWPMYTSTLLQTPACQTGAPSGAGLAVFEGPESPPDVFARPAPEFGLHTSIPRSVPRNRPNRSWRSTVARRRGNLGGSSSLFGFRVKGLVNEPAHCVLGNGVWMTNSPLRAAVGVGRIRPHSSSIRFAQAPQVGKPLIAACG